MSTPAISRKPVVALPKDPSACWLFLGTVTPQGYGKKCVGGRHVTCQRWLWEQLFGPIPDGMNAGTTCGERLCINPYHLVLRAHADSIRAGDTSGFVNGDIVDIRAVAPEHRNKTMAKLLGQRYGVSPRTIQDIWRDHTWTTKRRPVYPRPGSAAQFSRALRVTHATPRDEHAHG